VTSCSLNLWIADLGRDDGCDLEDHRGRPRTGSGGDYSYGKYTYEGDMDGVSVTKSKTGLVSKTIKTGGTDLRHLPSGVAITRTASI